MEYYANLAERYLQLLSRETKKTEQRRLQKTCRFLLQRAETLKANPSARLDPMVEREASTKELAIQLRSSRVDNQKYPPWKEPLSEVFQTNYEDTTTFQLSEEQEKVVTGWLSVVEVFPLLSSTTSHISTPFTTPSTVVLTQGLITNCSFISSLAAVWTLREPGSEHAFPKELDRIMLPWDDEHGVPGIAPNGHYVARFNFNGCFRRVDIDDRLPFISPSSPCQVFAQDHCEPSWLWPALLEKAYLKVCGGYHFPGSNSATDLWLLIGWIPEQILLQQNDIDATDLWHTICAQYRKKNLLITLGTTDSNEYSESLLPNHSYTVLDTQGEEAQDGRFLVRDSHVQASSVKQHNGIWTSWDDIVQRFHSIYLSWRPSLFPFRQDFHFDWQPSSVSRFITDTPQVALTPDIDGEVWVVLTRHFSNSTPVARKSMSFMGISVYHGNYRRDIRPKAIAKSPYVTSPDVLVKFSGLGGTSYLIVPDQDYHTLTGSYTFSIFTESSCQTCMPAPARLPVSRRVDGRWTRKTAGGSISLLSYRENPQYVLTITEATPVSVVLWTREGSQKALVHVAVLWSQGNRVEASVERRSIVMDSGSYSPGVCSAEMDRLQPGEYTLVCSTFEPGQLADFQLIIWSEIPVGIRPLTTESTGKLMFRPELLTLWPLDRLARITVESMNLTNVIVTVYSPTGNPPSIRLCMMQQQRGQEVILLNEIFDGLVKRADNVKLGQSRVVLEATTRSTDKATLVVERLGHFHKRDDFMVELLSETPLALGSWQWEKV